MSIEKDTASVIESFWKWRLINSPEFATSIGVHDYDNRLDEMNLNSYLRRKNEAEIYLKEATDILERASKENAEKSTLLNLNLLKTDLEQFINGATYQPYLWPINQLEGPQLDFPRLLSWMKTDSKDNMQKIISRLRLFPLQINEMIKLMKEGIRLGKTMHRVSVEPVISVLNDVSRRDVQESKLFTPFKTKPQNITDTDWESLIKEAQVLIVDKVHPSYKKLADFLQHEYLPKTRLDIGSSSLPNGAEYYRACLRFHTTTNFSPKEVHEIGKREVQRITERMEEVRKKIGFEGDLKAFRNFMRTEKKLKFSTAEEIVSHYKNVSETIKSVLPTLFERLPKGKFVVSPVPEDVAPSFPGAYYLAGAEDGSRPATFYINTYKPDTRSKYEAMSLCLHEAQPGHHLQTALTMESGDLVSFRRYFEDRKYYEPPARFAMNTGYIEGWGLYSEYLGEELGLYSDPYDFFGRLSHEMLRSCRLVVDTGMHALAWTKEKAIEYMMQNTAADLHDITAEVDRYITWPGQACGYKIGEIKIKELRQKAANKLGDKFDVKKFHDLLASMGSVPLKILESQVDSFILETSK